MSPPRIGHGERSGGSPGQFSDQGVLRVLEFALAGSEVKVGTVAVNPHLNQLAPAALPPLQQADAQGWRPGLGWQKTDEGRDQEEEEAGGRSPIVDMVSRLARIARVAFGQVVRVGGLGCG